MAESLKCKRVFFCSGKQKRFILSAKGKLNLTWNEMSGMLGINTRTLTDWKSEKFSMSFKAVEVICEKAKMRFPKDVKLKNPFWYVNKGAKKGGRAVYKKYGKIGGDSQFRKKRWEKWWKKEGQFKKISILDPKHFKRPKLSCELAEFIGIILGDGGISKYQITITLHCIDDLEYSTFVAEMIKRIFNITPSVNKKNGAKAINIRISRIELVNYFVNNLKLKRGNKVEQQIDIPFWIKKNKNYYLACVRGLIDTDGSVFVHKYYSNGKQYYYKKIIFTSFSRPILFSVFDFLKEVGIKSRVARDREVWIDSRENVERYFDMIGSHNEKHLKRYYK